MLLKLQKFKENITLGFHSIIRFINIDKSAEK